MIVSKSLALLLALLLLPLALSAQDSTTTAALPTLTAPLIPSSYRLTNIHWEPQKWNNCGPATVTNALSFFGYKETQDRAAEWLKPNSEDKNVSPWQMAEFVNTKVPELSVYAKVRYGGTPDIIKLLLANNFPVIVEEGYDPEPHDKGWMGHYIFVTGYDDDQGYFHMSDSYLGAERTYKYDYFKSMWKHFNYVFIVLYPTNREAELDTLLGPDADERGNVVRALEIARGEAIANNKDAFAWFNMGSNFVMLAKRDNSPDQYANAAIAYDQARSIGLPWRMMWYQFGPFEAYYNVGRYDDVLALAQANLGDGGGQFVEETYYYGGLARSAKGEPDRALANLTSALEFNPNFTPAKEALAALNGQQQSNGS